MSASTCFKSLCTRNGIIVTVVIVLFKYVSVSGHFGLEVTIQECVQYCVILNPHRGRVCV